MRLINLIVLLPLWIAACSAVQPVPIISTIPYNKVVIPEPIPPGLMAIPPCPEIDEITWGDARSASDLYRRCKDLRGQRIKDLSATIRGRYQWLRDQAIAVEEDNQKIKDDAARITQKKHNLWPF